MVGPEVERAHTVLGRGEAVAWTADGIGGEEDRPRDVLRQSLGLYEAAAAGDDDFVVRRHPMPVLAPIRVEDEKSLRGLAQTHGDACIGNLVNIGARKRKVVSF